MADDDRQAALNAIDLKGNIVLKEFGDTALLFRPQNNYEPFVVAYGYDKAAGEWSHGSYHTDLGHAFEEANPEIIEDACVRWQRGDIATALGNEEYPATDANVSWILNRSTMGDFHEEMTAKGNERLGEIVHEQERYLDKASGKNLAASEGRDAYLRPGVLEADNGQIGLSDMVDELRESARGSSRDAVSRDISHGGESI